MGAETWTITAAWRENVEEVLAETRAKVFREGTYQPIWRREFATLEELDAFFQAEPEVDEEGMVCLDGVGGTASILDIRGVSDVVEPGCTAPPSDERLLAVFGTRTPTLANVPEQCWPLFDDLDRGASYYVVGYEAGAPAAIVFLGLTWD